jgi:hypothetical protein
LGDLSQVLLFGLGEVVYVCFHGVNILDFAGKRKT